MSPFGALLGVGPLDTHQTYGGSGPNFGTTAKHRETKNPLQDS